MQVDRRGIARTDADSGVLLMGVESWPGGYADVQVGHLPGLRAFVGAIGRTRLARSSSHLRADGSDELVLIVNSTGRELVKTMGRELDLGPGHAVLVPADEAFVAQKIEPGMGQALRVPRAALARLVPRMTDLVGHRIGEESLPLHLLTSYMRSLASQALPATPELGRAIVGHVHDLMALSIASAFDGAALMREPSVAAARLQAVKDDIARNLTSADLSGPAVAARHRMTPRHLRRLFENEGTTYSAFVLSHRVARAHRMLTDPRLSARSIATIAYDCGFGDVSYFNLAFRRAYVATPSDVRSAALAPASLGGQARFAG